jgi:hypothetical protein
MKKRLLLITLLGLTQSSVQLNAMQNQPTQGSWLRPLASGLGVAGAAITCAFGKRFLDTRKKLQPFQQAKAAAQHNLNTIEVIKSTVKAKILYGVRNETIKSKINEMIIGEMPKSELVYNYDKSGSDLVSQAFDMPTYQRENFGKQMPVNQRACKFVQALEKIKSENEKVKTDNDPQITNFSSQQRTTGALTLVGLGLAGAGAGLYLFGK